MVSSSTLRAGTGGADQRLERVGGLLLNLLERREIAERRVEAIDGRQPILGSAACRIERALQGQDVPLQFVEFRSPDGAELVVGVESVANQRRFAIRGADPGLHRRFQGFEIGGNAIKDTKDFAQLLGGQSLARQLGQQAPGFF